MKNAPFRIVGRAAAVTLLIPATLALVVLGTPVAPAGAYPYADVSFVGHGWGHGIGMGQWGSLGYALNQDNGQGNWTYQQIVTHYYSGTSIQTISPSTEPHGGNVLVAMTENNGDDIIATSPSGMTLPGGGSAPAVLLQPSSNGKWNVDTGPGCAGPWTTKLTVANPTTGAVSGGQTTLCMSTSINLHGTLTGVFNSDGAARTVNTVALEQYVADVAPGESPSSWASLGGAGPQGQDWGFQQSEAQTVAARSYVEANPLSYGGYADTCDLTCQTYRGTTYETATSILAAQDTAGQVMEEGTKPGGTIATTEYSASTGGYTTGDQFPSVIDDGDGICVSTYVCNPNHTWHATLAVSSIEAQWPQIGTLDAIDVTSRNGEGDWGGRINRLSLVGSASTLSMTGSEFSDDLGLNSDWFTVSSQPSGGVGGYWLGAADGGIFSFGNAHFYGSMGGQPLNKPVVGMAPTSTTRATGRWPQTAECSALATPTSTARWAANRSINRSSVWRRRRMERATGWWPRTAASSASATPTSTARWGASASTSPSWVWPRPQMGWATGWLLQTAASSASATPTSTVQPGRSPSASPSPAWQWRQRERATGWSLPTGASSPSDRRPSRARARVHKTAKTLWPSCRQATGKGYLLVNGAGAATNYGDAPQFGDVTTTVSSYPGHVVDGATTPG